MSDHFNDVPGHHEDALDKELHSMVESCTPSLWERTMNMIGAILLSGPSADSANELDKQNCLRSSGYYEMQAIANQTASPNSGEQYDSTPTTDNGSATPTHDAIAPTTSPNDSTVSLSYKPAKITLDGSIEFKSDVK